MTSAIQREAAIRELRVVVLFGSKMRSLCKLVLSKHDASLYVVPYAPSNRYSVGTQSMGEGEKSVTFDVGQARDYGAAPKISFHQSGQVHANAGDSRVGPLQIPPLPDWRGEHLATVLAAHAVSLPDFRGPRRGHGAERDLVLDLRGSVESAKVVLFANGIEPQFQGPCPFQFRLAHASLTRPLFIGVLPQAQVALTDPDAGGGVVAIGGWTPSRDPDTPVDFLYIRGS